MFIYFIFLWLIFSGTNCNSNCNNKLSFEGNLNGRHVQACIKRRHKYLSSRFRYYPNTDASFNVERNPGRSKSYKTNTNQSLTFVLQNVKKSLKSVLIDSSNSPENKLSCFKDIVFAHQFDVIALTETWLHNSVADHEIIPNGYQIIRRDRQMGKRGGGVLLSVKETIATEPFAFKCDSLELSSVILKSFSKRVLVAVCYRPLDAENDFLHNLNGFVKSAINSNIKDIILLGDFNFPNIQWVNGWDLLTHLVRPSLQTCYRKIVSSNS